MALVPSTLRPTRAPVLLLGPLMLLVLLLVLLLVAGCAGVTRGLRLEAGSNPVYPPEARAAGIEGWVEVAYAVDAQGHVRDVRVVEAQPSGVFDAAALRAVSSWRYAPARRGGVAVALDDVRSRVEFRLGEAWRDF